MTAAALGFDRPTANSLDAVSDRDFVIETLAAASLCAVHLSRFAEEIVIWSSAGFGFIRLSDRFTTGSSIMPQKRNPDAAELVRAKSGRIIGALTALLIVLKGLPLAYQKDMQEDKEQAFDAIECADARDRRDRRHGPRHGAGQGGDAEGGGRRLLDRDRPCRLAGPGSRPHLPRRRTRSPAASSASPRSGEPPAPPADARRDAGRSSRGSPRRSSAVLGVTRSVASRTSYGGTAPQNVRREAKRWLAKLAKESPG